MKIEVPEKVEYIINTLKENGHEAYAVGGCVRDSILNRIPGDWDITTSASPWDVKELFPRTIDTGIQHGTVTVMLDKEGFEVTTYRLDGEYEDCRHPKQVEFTKSLEEDLKRRDFTINAMAYNNEDGIVDLFEGLEDIKRRRIRCVGSAVDRFEEDALRILRAVRFSAQIDFDIDDETREAIIQKAENLANISAERVREELNKLFLSLHPDRLQIAYETGITKIVLPEFDQKKKEVIEIGSQVTNLGDVCLLMLNLISQKGCSDLYMYEPNDKKQVLRKLTSKEKLCLSYAVILHSNIKDSSEEVNEASAVAAKRVLQRLKFDNETIGMVTKLVRFCQFHIDSDTTSVRKAMNHMGVELMDLWFLLKRIMMEAEVSIESNKQHNHLESLYHLYTTIMNEKHCVCLKDLSINGRDLIQLGCQPGVGLGVLLEYLLSHVLEHPEDNNRETLIVLAKRKISE